MRCQGREFSEGDIAEIREKIERSPGFTRSALSKWFCELRDWRQHNGKLKDTSCRKAFLQLHRAELIQLPPPKWKATNQKPKIQLSLFSLPKPEISPKAGDLELTFRIVHGQGADSRLWVEFIERYHYLGYMPSPGATLRYFIEAGGEPLALLGFGASAWKTAPRDEYIGWSHEQRKRNLNLIVNNSRFLILPWVRSRNLASRILSMAARRIQDDWQEYYSYRPVLLETFVEKQRFTGTCYKASNWKCVGETKGRGKLDRHNKCAVPVKTIWLYPLEKSFRTALGAT